jgi:hypothetical protein
MNSGWFAWLLSDQSGFSRVWTVTGAKERRMSRLAPFPTVAAIGLLSVVLSGGGADAQGGSTFTQPQGSRTVCTQQYDPVCAVRGGSRRTFGNACEAGRAGYRIVYGGECGRGDRAQFCTREYAPVCATGRSGRQTFGNECEARVAGYRVIRRGRC